MVGLNIDINGLRNRAQVTISGLRGFGKRTRPKSGSLLRLRGVLAGALAMIMVLSTGVAQTARAAPPEWAKGRILVAPRAGLADTEFSKILKGKGSRTLGKIGKLNVHIVQVPPKAEKAVVQALSKSKHIKFAELDMLLEPGEVVPNDANYSSAWHLPMIGGPSAWETALGQNIVVAILDTGVDDTHPDLAGKIIPGWNAANGGSDTSDVHGHGTAVAGTAAAISNNSIGVASVAWSASILPVRVTDQSNGYAYYSTIAKALDWATDNGAHVANISYDVTPSSSVSSAAQRMRNNGGVVVVAAGNSSDDPGYNDNPYMISVSATTSSDSKASWSSYGAYVDVSAPGASIWTTNRGGGYGRWNGTSFASPVTAGVVALIMSANPALSPGEIESILEFNADDLGDLGWDSAYGYGRVNAYRAVIAASQSTAQDTQPPTASIDAPGEGATVAGLVSVDVTASDNVGISRVDLHQGNNEIGSVANKPFGFSWNSGSVQDGWVSLTAYAYDEAGNESGPDTVNVLVDNVEDPVDTTPPVVAISEPANGSTVSRTTQIRVDASDNVALTLIRLYIDGTLKVSTNTSPLTYSWNTRKAADGPHTIRAEAEDAAGHVSSHSINVSKSASTGRGKKKKN